MLRVEELSPIPLPDLPATQPHRSRLCAGPGCETPVLLDRFCDECLADAAKDLAQQIEAKLIAAGFAPGSEKLRDVLPLEPTLRPLDWFAEASILGHLHLREAVYLRRLTESACLLLRRGGVAALANLPGTRRGSSPPIRIGVCDFRALPQWDEPAAPPPAPPRSDLKHQQRVFDTIWFALLLALLAVLVVG